MNYSQSAPLKFQMIRIIIFSFCAIVFASTALGQSGGGPPSATTDGISVFQINPSAITGGGNTTANGPQSITGAIGQSALGTTAGGTFTITGGLFSINAIAFKYGDVNSDQTITVSDLVLVANFIAGNIPANSPSFNKAAADVNLDGSITISDLVILANFIAGNIPSLPVGH